MVLQTPSNSETTCSHSLTMQEYYEVDILSSADANPTKINDLFCVLIKVGWPDLFENHFTKEHSTDVDMDLVNWILRGEMDTDPNNRYKEILSLTMFQSNLNEVLDFLRKSNGDINFCNEDGQTILHVFLRSCLRCLTKNTLFRVVKALIELGASVDVIDKCNYTPFHIVIERKEKELIKLMLPHFTNVAIASGYDADSVLHDVIYACMDDTSYEDQYTDIIRILISKGADPNMRNECELTPVHLAVTYNFFEMLLIFKSNGGDFHVLTHDDETLLHLACNANKKNPSNQLKIINFLVSEGCDVNAKDKNGNSPLHLAVKFRCAKITERLVELGSDVHSRTKNLHLTPLHCAVSFDQSVNVEYLLKNGADVDAEDKNGVTSLHIAASRNSFKSFKYLIDHGADVHRREKIFDFTPLHIATSYGKKKVELLLKKRASAKVSNRDGVTPLHLASLAGNLKVVQILTIYNADVNCRGGNLKVTPLHLTSMWNNTKHVKSLIFNDEDMRDKKFHGMFNWISNLMMDRSNHVVAKWLIKHGTDVNVKDAAGRTPLHLATLQQKSNMVKLLLKFGAHVDELDDEFRSPMDNVLKCGAMKGLKCLLKYGMDINDVDVMVNEYKQEVVNYLLHHAMKMKILDLPLRDYYNCSINEYDIEHFLEVDKLKNHMIHGSDVSLYNFLHMKPRGQAILAKRVRAMNLRAQFPLYFHIIHASRRQAVNRVSLLEPAVSALRRITDTWWPELCVDKIFSYFNNNHLRNLIASAEIDVV